MKKFFLFTLAVLAFVACTQNDVEELAANRADVPETLTVGFEGDDTRIQLNEAQKTVWNAGDEVSVFYKSYNNLKFEFQGETGDRIGSLKRVGNGEAGDQMMDNMVVVYPYSDDYRVSLSTGAIDAYLPAVQYYAEGSYGVGSNLMVAQSGFTQFSLKSVCGWLRIDLTGEGQKVCKISLQGNNGEQLAGLINVDTNTAEAILASSMGEYDDIENGVGGNVELDNSIITTLTLDCGEGVELGKEATSFYFAVPPQSYAKGFTAEVVCDGYKPMVLQHSSAITIERNHIKPMASVNFNTERLDPEIILQSSAITEFDIDGGYGEIKYDILNGVDGVTLNASCSAEWITNIAIDHSGRTVIYKVATNNTEETREAKITLTYGEAKAEITVKQKAAVVPVFEQKPAKPEISVRAAGGEGAIGYKLENPVKGVEVAATADVDWLTILGIDTEKCRITYYASETDTKSERTGHITATYGNLSFVVTLIQDGGSEMFSILGLDPYVCSPSAEAYSCSFQVKFPVDRTILPTAEVKYLTAGQEGWITDFEFSVNEEKDEATEEETTPSTFNETEGEGETETVIKDIAQGSIKFNIAANPSDNERQAEITYTYNGKKVTQTIIQETDAAIPMRLIVNGGESEPDRASILAKMADNGKTWTLTLLDHMDKNYGVLQTDLVFSLPEDKASENYLPSGKYTSDSFLEGTVEWIDKDNFVATGSVYHRNNAATVAPITGDDRFVEINVNPDTQVVTVKGQFNTLKYDSANSRYIKTQVSFEYTGPVRGFRYADLDKGITEWNSVKIFNSWLFSGGYEYMVKGHDTNNVEVFMFDLYAVGATDKSTIPAGEYPVMQLTNPVTESLCSAYSTMYNTPFGISLASGKVIITDNPDGTQTLEFDVVDVEGTKHKGSYTGAITK